MGWVVSFRRPSSQKYAFQGPWEPVMARGVWEHQDTGPQASVESLPVDLDLGSSKKSPERRC